MTHVFAFLKIIKKPVSNWDNVFTFTQQQTGFEAQSITIESAEGSWQGGWFTKSFGSWQWTLRLLDLDVANFSNMFFFPWESMQI